LEKKYLNVALETSNEQAEAGDIHVITKLQFHKGAWHVQADYVCKNEENKFAVYRYAPADELGDPLLIKIARGSIRNPGLRTYIKKTSY